jgi:hypothetical protein
MGKKKEMTWICVLGAVFVFLIILGILYPALGSLENSKPSKNVTINKSKSSFDFNNMFDFSSYANLSLGEVCGDLEDCLSVCSEDMDKCEEYCDGNHENELCSKIEAFTSSDIVTDYIEDNNITSPEDLDLENLPPIPDNLPEDLPIEIPPISEDYPEELIPPEPLP